MADDFLATSDASAQSDPKAQVNPDDPATWGDGYPNAPDEVQSAMREMVQTYEAEQLVARLEQIRQILRNREFYAGRQVIYWSASETRWKSPTASDLGISEEEFQELDPTNLYRGKVQIVMAELSQSPPRTAFTPEHAKVQADIRLAKDATNITNLINRENRIDEKLPYEIWLLCNDAAFAEYWRFVRDEKFGIEDYQVPDGPPTEIELSPDQAICPECDESQATESAETAPSMCPTCAAPMGPGTFSPRETAMHQPMKPAQRPAGREVCDVVGMLEMVLPVYEKDENELGFLTWCREVHRSKLMTVFPHAADAIQAGGGAGTATAANERIARLSLMSGWQRNTDGQVSLATFRETWFRPWTYQTLREKQSDMRDKFLRWFPDGFRVAFAGDVYCGSWADKLQDHWTICHAFPGDGQYRGAIGTDAITTQRKYNKCDSIQIDTYEGGLPFLVTDNDLWEKGALPGRTEANAIYGVQGRGNKTVSNSVWQSKPTEVSPQLIDYQNSADRIMDSQFGTYAPMYGGDLGNNDTKGGIQIERNAAKGQLGLVFRALKNFRARADLKNVRLFLANRTQDVEIAVEGPGSEADSVQISLADLREGNVQIKIEEDESYPVSLNEQRMVVTTLFNNQNPEVMSWFSDIANASELVDLLGVADRIRVPGSDAREKCFDIIAELVKTAPIQPPPPPMMPPTAGMVPPGMPPPMPAPPPPPEPSIQPDPVLDDLAVYVKTCQEWAASAAGRKAMVEAMDTGYANVRAFAQKCLMLLAPPPMPMGPPAGNGGPPGGNKALPAPPEANPTGPLPAMGIQ